MRKSFTFLAAAAAMLAAPLSIHAITTSITYNDGVGEGFNDATVVGSTTLGAQRKQAFEYAVEIWAKRIGGSQTVTIQAQFDPLGGTGVSATLAYAGPGTAYRDTVPALPQAGTWYPKSLVKQLLNLEPNGAVFDIEATFNTDVDNNTVLGTTNWYYGLDENPGSNVSMVRTTLHELGHGLGFLGFLTTDGNGDNPDGTYSGGFPGIFDRSVQQGSGSGTALTGMTTGNRLTAIKGDNLYFFGTNTVASVGSTPRTHAPATWQPGSSYSHFREATPVGGVEELMEPILNSNAIVMTNTDDVFKDLGYTILGTTALPKLSISSAPSTITEGTGAQSFTVSLTAAQSENVTATIQTGGTATLNTDYTISTTSITITPPNTSANFTVTAANDAADAGETVTLRLTRIVNAEFGTTTTSSTSIQEGAAVGEWTIY